MKQTLNLNIFHCAAHFSHTAEPRNHHAGPKAPFLFHTQLSHTHTHTTHTHTHTHSLSHTHT